MSRGYILPSEIKGYIEAELKKRKLQNIAVERYMKDKNCDEKTARKAIIPKVEEKVEKGAPSRLGPALYGLTDQFVKMRADGVTELEKFIHEYLSAVDQLREVAHKNSGCFVVSTTNLKLEKTQESILPVEEHKNRMANLQIPQMKM